MFGRTTVVLICLYELMAGGIKLLLKYYGYNDDIKIEKRQMSLRANY
jgi:hypothetical protein